VRWLQHEPRYSPAGARSWLRLRPDRAVLHGRSAEVRRLHDSGRRHGRAVTPAQRTRRLARFRISLAASGSLAEIWTQKPVPPDATEIAAPLMSRGHSYAVCALA